MVTQSRPLYSHLAVPERGCLYCLGDGPSTGEEHVIQARFGIESPVLPAGVVCDGCNSWLGRQVDVPFTDRFDITLTRALEDCRGRAGWPAMIESRDAICEMKIEVGGGTAFVQAASVAETDHGVDIEIRPRTRDPEDIVARTVRAMWKMALGVMWLQDAAAVMDPQWDHLRHAVLGHPFKAYLLQRQFTVAVARQMHVSVDMRTAEEPTAMTFAFGGVALAVPLKQGKSVPHQTLVDRGWEPASTLAKATNIIRLHLDPTALEDAA